MNKLIIKTAAITAGILLFISIVVYGCFALFAPAKMSEFYDGVGSGAVALRYAERAYEKDNSQQNLIITLRRAVAANNSKKIVEYSEILFDNKNNLTGEELVFFQNRYCFALYDLDDSSAVFKATQFSLNYLPGNALECLAASALDKKDIKTLNLILPNLENIASSPDVAQENIERVRGEIELITSFLGLSTSHNCVTASGKRPR